MMSQLRWALLILGVVFIVVLAIWERRRPRQASGALELPPWREGGAEPPVRRVSEFRACSSFWRSRTAC